MQVRIMVGILAVLDLVRDRQKVPYGAVIDVLSGAAGMSSGAARNWLTKLVRGRILAFTRGDEDRQARLVWIGKQGRHIVRGIPSLGKLGRALEAPFRFVGATRWLGSPVLALYVRKEETCIGR